VFLNQFNQQTLFYREKKSNESLIFLTEKKDRTIKARMCTNGSSQRKYTGLNKAASPTALTESHLIIAVINAKQH
jgi:hypothetical protein